jgi:hypothetical protein
MKKFAVMLNNNLYAFRIESAARWRPDTALLYNDNVFELPLKNKTKERNSNKQLAFRNLRSVFIMRRTYS